MKKIIVTGSAGFVGHHFVQYVLEKTDWKIIGLDSFKHRGDSLRVDPEGKDRYQIYTCDLSAPLSHRLKDQIGPVDYIVNFASESHVDRSILDPVPFVQNNVNLMLSILEYAREVQPEKFIQISTDEVYGAAPEGVDYKEWAPILPSNPYSASKAAQEAISISYWRTYNVPLILTNTMNMFGERQDPEKYIPMLISRINQGKHVEVHGSSEYIGKRHYLHAKDFSDALLFLLKEVNPQLFDFKNCQNLKFSSDQLSPSNETYPSRFNVIGQVELDNYQMAEKIAQILGKELSCVLIDFHRARPGHDTRYSLCGEKLDQLGWKHPFSFQKSLEKTIEWTLKNPVWMN